MADATSGAASTGVLIHSVDDEGVHVTAATDTVVDVLVDGRRIWSFWTLRDSEPADARRVAPWPPQLRPYLDGTAQLSLVEHVSGRVLLDEQVALGSGSGSIAIVDQEGRQLGIDKSNRLAATFDTRDREQVVPLLDAIEQVLTGITEAGVEAFLAYGTLLGAVREGDFIGHDSDIDLGYVSRHTHPLDVIRESFQLQRALTEKGFLINRYSAAAFKVDVREADGSVWGLDVFGGYLLHGQLCLMGEIRTPFEQDWIFPLTTATLAGRSFPVPARPEKLLEATYGPGWQVPDPAFHFTTPRSTHRRLNGWFRGIRTHRADWDRRYSGRRTTMPNVAPSPLARYVLEQEQPHRVVDVGAGRGADALWFARKGIPAIALDHSRGADDAVRRTAAAEGLAYDSEWLNLHELRSVIAQGARVAHLDGPTTVLANHLLDATDRRGLAAFARFARMALSGGGRLYADFLSAPAGAGRAARGADLLQPLPTAGVVRALERHGAHIVLISEVPDNSPDPSPDTVPGQQPGRPVARVVAEWRT